jgi:hypothetical protein
LRDHNATSIGGESIVHHDPLQYREYKLLLRAERFVHSQQFHKFWKITRRVAKSIGIAIHKRGKPMETHLREVLFFARPSSGSTTTALSCGGGPFTGAGCRSRSTS